MLKASPEVRPLELDLEPRKAATHCPYCAVGCAMELSETVLGTVEAKGTPHPVNRGKLCVLGQSSVSLLNHAERLTQPLVRIGGELVPTSWEAALTHAAAGFDRIRTAHGGAANGVYSGASITNEKAYLIGKFARIALSTPNVDYNGRYCMSAAATAANKAFGLDRGLNMTFEDLQAFDLIVIVVGNGMVGQKVLTALAAGDTEGRYHVTAFAEEVRPAYDRVNLSTYFTTRDAEALAPVGWFEERSVTLSLGDGVSAVDRKNKTVTTRQGKTLSYDKLILATGSAAFVPPVPGVDKAGVFVYRTIEDLEALIAYSKSCRTAAVIGGGLLGLEAAKALLDMGLETHVVQSSSRLMPRQLDDKSALLVKKKLETMGLHVHLGKRTREMLGEDKVTGLTFEDGETLNTDLVLISAGIAPRDELAREAGLEVGSRGGVIVDERLTTSDPDIYAVGECALAGGLTYGLVAPGYRMAVRACWAATFVGADMSTKLKSQGVDVASIGDAVSEKETLEETLVMNARAGTYKKLLVGPDNTLRGAVLVGDASDYSNLLQLYLNKMPLPDAPESLLVTQTGGAVGAGVAALPDTATICSCENVSKGALALAVQEGVQDVSGLTARKPEPAVGAVCRW